MRRQFFIFIQIRRLKCPTRRVYSKRKNSASKDYQFRGSVRESSNQRYNSMKTVTFATQGQPSGGEGGRTPRLFDLLQRAHYTQEAARAEQVVVCACVAGSDPRPGPCLQCAPPSSPRGFQSKFVATTSFAAQTSKRSRGGKPARDKRMAGKGCDKGWTALEVQTATCGVAFLLLSTPLSPRRFQPPAATHLVSRSSSGGWLRLA